MLSRCEIERRARQKFEAAIYRRNNAARIFHAPPTPFSVAEKRRLLLAELLDAEWEEETLRINILRAELSELDRLEESGQLYICNF